MKKFLKSAYDLIPLKKAIFSALKTVYSPPHNVYQHLSFKDKFKVAIDPKHSFWINHYGFYVENSVFWKGVCGHESLSVGMWIELSKDAQTILDVGANTGLYSLISKAVNPTASVYAFEPVIRVYEKLCDNLRLNNYRVEAIRKALSNADGEAIICDPGQEHIYSVTVNGNLNPENVDVEKVTIETQRLDSFVKSNNLQNLDLVKIDVETHEAQVLEGFGKCLERFKPIMLIEILNDEVGANVQRILSDHQYTFYHVDDTNKILKFKENITGIPADLNYLAVPSNKVAYVQKVYSQCLLANY